MTVSSPSKRSGKSVKMSAVTSPRSPRGFTIFAIATSSSMPKTAPLVLDQVDVKTLALFHPAKIENTSERLDRSALTSYQTPVIAGRDAHAELHSLAAVRVLRDVDRIRVANEGLNNFFDSFFHLCSLDSLDIKEVSEVLLHFLDSLYLPDFLDFFSRRIILDQA